MVALIDTNVLVYVYDPRFPAKQRIAEAVVEDGVRSGALYLPHQAVVEFVAAVTRRRPVQDDPAGKPLLEPAEAWREAEELMTLLPVLYPTPEVLRTAFRGAATYRLSWFDAHLWAYAEVYGVPTILSEDFEHRRLYGAVQAIDPFRPADTVHEPVAPYGG